MSRLIIGLLKEDKDEVETFHEFDMSWVELFNKGFESTDIPFKEKIYSEEFVDTTAASVLSELVTSENDSEFKVNREPLKQILYNLFKIQ